MVQYLTRFYNIFGNIVCLNDLSKIDQSGHTVLQVDEDTNTDSEIQIDMLLRDF